MVDQRAVIVARRAAELAEAMGVVLANDMALWALAGGRPPAESVPGRPEELGELLESSFDPSARRRQGAHYTPEATATGLVGRALRGCERPSIGDPGCGGGALLLAAARHLAAHGEDPADVVGRLWGADVDAVAVATTEVALTLWAGAPPPAGRCTVADALVDDLGWPPLDVVVGNPPFLSQLDAPTTRPPPTTQRLRERFGPAVRAYTDTSSLFLLLACELVASGGTAAVLQPQSVLAARDAAGVRAAVEARGRLAEVWFPDGPGFDASVDVCVPIIEVGGSGDGDGWGGHLARANGVPPVGLSVGRTLADEATTTAAFRTEYYGMVDHVHEAADRPDGAPLVTTGLIDLGHCAWGERPARIGRRPWERPVLDVGALDGRAADWVRRTRVPKLVVATQTRVVEVAVDETGDWVPGVPLVVVLAPPARLWPLAAALAAPAVSAWLLERVAGTALTPSSLKVTAALLREVPLPTDDTAWRHGTEALRDGDLAGFVDAMGVAYGVGVEVTDWWRPRATTVWSRPGMHQ
ncbi:MAG: N-6 DNA methylase [Acidimicrobiales bacterium]